MPETRISEADVTKFKVHEDDFLVLHFSVDQGIGLSSIYLSLFGTCFFKDHTRSRGLVNENNFQGYMLE